MECEFKCPRCGVPKNTEGLCWCCRQDLKRNAALAWTPEEIAAKQEGLIQDLRNHTYIGGYFTTFSYLLGCHDAITPEIQRVALSEKYMIHPRCTIMPRKMCGMA